MNFIVTLKSWEWPGDEEKNYSHESNELHDEVDWCSIYCFNIMHKIVRVIQLCSNLTIVIRWLYWWHLWSLCSWFYWWSSSSLDLSVVIVLEENSANLSHQKSGGTTTSGFMRMCMWHDVLPSAMHPQEEHDLELNETWRGLQVTECMIQIFNIISLYTQIWWEFFQSYLCLPFRVSSIV